MNIAFALIRIVACYAVVSIHFGHRVPFADLAVPVFMFTAFYFYNAGGDVSSLCRRLKRIAIPMLSWGLIGFVARCIVEHSFDLKMLGLQVIFGMPANSPLYFMNLVLVNTIIVWILLRLKTGGGGMVMLVMAAVCMFVEYSGINSRMWTFLPWVGEVTCGRFVELLPCALLGSLCGRYKRVFRPQVLIPLGLVFATTYFVACHVGLDACVPGYDYQGLARVLGATGICVLASLCPIMDKNDATFVPRFICVFSGLTAGIYYSHKIVGEAVKVMLPLEGWMMTLSVFVLAAALVCVGTKIRYVNVIVK